VQLGRAALLADADHNLSDALGLGGAWAAVLLELPQDFDREVERTLRQWVVVPVLGGSAAARFYSVPVFSSPPTIAQAVV
jgi:hypothetical protein